jgi:hypothetical protein
MADWKSLTAAQQKHLRQKLADALIQRGIQADGIVLEASGLPGRYRLYVTAAEFGRLDYSERLAVLANALSEAWPRDDQLRLTLQFALAPDELSTPTAVPRTRGRTAGAGRKKKRTA